MPVEVNALWYNAISFYVELAERSGAKHKLSGWKEILEKIRGSFTDTFWDNEKAYLADYVNGDHKNWDIRPNMIFVASLPFSPVSDMIKAAVVKKVKEELLTSRGLRTLSPSHPDYRGAYAGEQNSRDKAYHQGSVWPWLFGHYAEAYLRIRKKAGINKIEDYMKHYEENIYEHGIGTIPELFDGDPPHSPRGGISYACSVGEILRVLNIIEKIKKEK